eukprot:3260213-Rhodomonas_salina.9
MRKTSLAVPVVWSFRGFAFDFAAPAMPYDVHRYRSRCIVWGFCWCALIWQRAVQFAGSGQRGRDSQHPRGPQGTKTYAMSGPNIGLCDATPGTPT